MESTVNINFYPKKLPGFRCSKTRVPGHVTKLELEPFDGINIRLVVQSNAV